jgi:hypothetical protein
MTDIFDHPVLCNKCNQKMKKVLLIKNGFKIRALECQECGKQTQHPLDKKEYENFEKIKDKQFNVKLRMVGNSYTVSIPREIIEFHEEMNREITEMINMSLEEPERLTLYFRRRILK